MSELPSKFSFNDEEVEWCRGNRVELYSLTGRTLQSLKDCGVVFLDPIPAELQDARSMVATVGLDLDYIFLAKSNWPFQAQILFDWYKHRHIERQSGTLTAIQAGIADYAELATLVEQDPERKLFGANYAKTSTDDTRDILRNKKYEIGGSARGLRIRSWYTKGRAENSFIFPLIVSKEVATASGV